MPDSTLLRLLLPVVMAASAVIGWLAARSRRSDSTPTWRDSSLDDWRREQNERYERERSESDEQLDGEP